MVVFRGATVALHATSQEHEAKRHVGVQRTRSWSGGMKFHNAIQITTFCHVYTSITGTLYIGKGFSF